MQLRLENLSQRSAKSNEFDKKQLRFREMPKRVRCLSLLFGGQRGVGSAIKWHLYRLEIRDKRVDNAISAPPLIIFTAPGCQYLQP